MVGENHLLLGVIGTYFEVGLSFRTIKLTNFWFEFSPALTKLAGDLGVVQVWVLFSQFRSLLLAIQEEAIRS